MESSSSIKRNALNLGYPFGALYNAAKDNFIGPNLYRISDLTDYTTRIDIGSNKYFNFCEESSSKKFSNFEIDASLSLSVMSGAISVTGNAKYLKEGKQTNKRLKWNIGLLQRTCEENLNIFDKKLKNINNVSQEDIQIMIKCGATHFVTGIEWGVQVTALIEFEEMEQSEQEEIKGSLGVSFKNIVNGMASINFDSSTKEKFERTNFTLISDCQPYLDTGLVTNVEMFSQYLRQIPKLITSINAGKGVPVKYTLFPIKEYLYDLNLRIDNIFIEISNSTINTIQKYFDKFNEGKVLVNDLLEDCRKFPNMFREEIKALAEQEEELYLADIVFKEDISKKIIQFRSGKLLDNQGGDPLLINLESILAKIGKYNPIKFLSENEEVFSRLSDRVSYFHGLKTLSKSSNNELHFIDDYNQQSIKFGLTNKDLIIISLDFNMLKNLDKENFEILNYFQTELKNRNPEGIFLVIDYGVDQKSFIKDHRPIRPIFKYYKAGKLIKLAGK